MHLKCKNVWPMVKYVKEMSRLLSSSDISINVLIHSRLKLFLIFKLTMKTQIVVAVIKC